MLFSPATSGHVQTEVPTGLPAERPQARAHSHWQAGLAQAAQGQWALAARSFGRATRAAPDDALYWVNLANAQRHAGALPRAVAAARRALQLSSGDAIAVRVLGVCLVQMHRYAEAVQALAELEVVGGSTPEIMVQHASALLSLQRPKAAAEVQ